MTQHFHRSHFRSIALRVVLSACVAAAHSSIATARANTSNQAGGDAPKPAVPLEGAGVRGSREATWFAPTAEDWKRPCLITWQRSYEDALAVSRETKKPILVCVNMDGEIASEHYAGVRYREAGIAKLYEPYVCVIASVYRHNPRDYDEQGRRILCPRFGSVTCGEHISIEPGLFDKFMDGRRIAPRHIGVEIEAGNQEMYDVFYAYDTDTIFNTLREGIANRTTVPVTVVRDDRPIVERVASPDIHDRTAVESAYLAGDRDARRTLLEAARARGGAAPVDLLRLAVFGLDVELSQLARRALAQSTSESAIDLIADALRVPMGSSERDALIAALVRLGESFPRARTLAVVYQGLANRSSAIDVEGWAKALETATSAAKGAESSELASRLAGHAKEYEAHPDDATAQLEFAESTLAVAVDPNTARRFSRVMLEDAHRAALRAEALGATGWRVSSAVAIAAYRLGDMDEAYSRAEAAVREMPADAQGWNAMAVMALFAQARQDAIAKALRDKTDWPAQWLTDVNAAYTVLAHHPLGTDQQVASHHDFLKRLGATGQAARVLDEGLTRFPDSWALHERLRGRILAEKGADGLEDAYATMLRDKDARPNVAWYAGYASLVAAEFHRRAGRDADAVAAYDRGIAHFDRYIEANPDGRATADHYVALAIAGRARLALERGDYDRAVADVLASFERRPDAAATLDGLNLSPVDTAKMLLAKVKELKRDDLAAALDTALAKLDPELLRLPAYEREGPNGTTRDGRPPRRQR